MGDNLDDAQQRAEAAIAAELSRPETRQALVNELNQLGRAAIQIDQAFMRVSNELNAIDNHNYTNTEGSPLPRLRPDWNTLHNRFKNMLWRSRDLATDTATYILDFYKNYLPVIEEIIAQLAEATPEGRRELIDEAQATFDEFIQRENPATGPSPLQASATSEPLPAAEARSQSFLNFKNEMASFRERIEDFGDCTSQKLKVRLARVNSTFQNLEAQIESYTKKVKTLGFALLSEGVFACVGALAALYYLTPGIAMTVAGIGVVGELALYLYKNKKSKELVTLLESKSKLQDEIPDISYICERLDKFANIWGLVASDAREVNQQLQTVAGTRSRLLENRITLLRSSYAALYSGLKEYATMVSNSGILDPNL